MNHHKDSSELKKLKGLTSEEVIASREKHGSNVLTPAPRDPWWVLLLEKFDDPIIRILMIAAVVAIGVGTIHGEYLEGVGIVIAILLATILAFANEFKAAKEFDILNQVSDEVQIKVIRGGMYSTVAIKDLVVGDIVMIEPGDEVPADGNLIDSVSLQIDEARLTGESMPVNKHLVSEADESAEDDDAYSRDFLLRSTLVFDGRGTMRVTAVGDNTEIGKAARSAGEETDEPTPLNLQLDRLSKIIGVVGFSVAFLTFIALVIRGYALSEILLEPQQWAFAVLVFLSAMLALARVWVPIIEDGFSLAGRKLKLPKIFTKTGIVPWLKLLIAGMILFTACLLVGTMTGYLPEDPEQWLTAEAISDFLKFFMIAVTIIVVAVPEGLPMSVTLSLAYSMRRMTAANNLVRRMHACETIGAATVICSDKTGTLTQNKMVMNSVFFPVLGTDNLDPSLKDDSHKVIAEAIAANSTANLNVKDSGEVSVIGNPTEGATILWLKELGVDYLALRQSFDLAKQWTFSTETKMMASYGHSGQGEEKVLYVKGAPEIVLGNCKTILTPSGIVELDDKQIAAISHGLKDSQNRGMRTLAMAFSTSLKSEPEGAVAEVAKNLVWLGYVAIADPIRPDVPKALEVCRQAGVAVKVITGDNSNTAWEIAGQIGLIAEDDKREEVLMTGAEFQALSDEEAYEAADKIKIMARARPADKLKMVKLLQKRRHVVAVTGDGTNDAPALNHANVGLAMGITGTSVAKEASDIILLDDSFPSVVKGIMWGRSLYQNIQRFIMFQLTINVVALAIALTGPFIGVRMPLTVVQMLWVNLIMDTFAALALATEPPHWKVMASPPRKPDDFIVTKSMYMHIFGVGFLFYVLLFGFLKYFQQDGRVDLNELSVFFTTFVMLQVWNMFNARALGLGHSAFRGILDNRGFMAILPAIILGQFLIVQYGSTMFRTEPLPLVTWLTIIIGTSVVLWAGELFRFVYADKGSELVEDLDPFE